MADERTAAHTPSRLWRWLLWAIPRTMWTVVDRDGHSEFVIWRQWRGRAYDINSVVSVPGRYDRETEFGRRDDHQDAHRSVMNRG